MRTADLCTLLAGAKHQAPGKKLSDIFETLQCVAALLFFQEVYFSIRARVHKPMFGTPVILQSLFDVFP
jgi:hypothetical protein